MSTRGRCKLPRGNSSSAGQSLCISVVTVVMNVGQSSCLVAIQFKDERRPSLFSYLHFLDYCACAFVKKWQIFKNNNKNKNKIKSEITNCCERKLKTPNYQPRRRISWFPSKEADLAWVQSREAVGCWKEWGTPCPRGRECWDYSFCDQESYCCGKNECFWLLRQWP